MAPPISMESLFGQRTAFSPHCAPGGNRGPAGLVRQWHEVSGQRFLEPEQHTGHLDDIRHGKPRLHFTRSGRTPSPDGTQINVYQRGSVGDLGNGSERRGPAADRHRPRSRHVSGGVLVTGWAAGKLFQALRARRRLPNFPRPVAQVPLLPAELQIGWDRQPGRTVASCRRCGSTLLPLCQTAASFFCAGIRPVPPQPTNCGR